jgi:hypothetical protein
MNDIIKLKRDITKTQIKLIAKFEKDGLYENFGQKEVKQLEDKHIDISSYTNEMNEKRKIIQEFDDGGLMFHGIEGLFWINIFIKTMDIYCS